MWIFLILSAHFCTKPIPLSHSNRAFVQALSTFHLIIVSFMTSTAATQIPWGSLNTVKCLFVTVKIVMLYLFSLLWFPVFKHSHGQGAFMGWPSPLCRVWLCQFTPVLSHITLTPSVSPLSTSSTGILTFYFLPPLLFSVTPCHCHPSLLKT